ncbi:MAG TPA: polysaccharide deacetylase family protein [Bauldia sp.]|nr:polysaccharide deacetylase family protein [Bauldia sp.]
MAGKRQVVVHEDDIGMCHGANLAFADLTADGICTCGAVMVPCPWFLEIAEMQAKDPRLDIGVHLVLTSEFKNYRWRPLTGASQASGLVDGDGYFWPTAQEARAHAHPDAVEAELRAQVEAARKAGIDITHIDAHMFTVVCPEFVDIYVRLGIEERVPVLLVRQEAAYGNIVRAPEMQAAVDAAESAGRPVFDRILETPWTRGASVEDDYRALFDRIGDGLTYMALHFNAPGEIEAIAPHEHGVRPDEYALFKRGFARRQIERLGAELIGMRAIRDRLRAAA